MQIVIEISEGIIEYVKNNDCLAVCFADEVAKAIKNGIQLPKGHGDLIDRNKIEYLKAINSAKFGHTSWDEAIKSIKYSAPTIIEAEKD